MSERLNYTPDKEIKQENDVPVEVHQEDEDVNVVQPEVQQEEVEKSSKDVLLEILGDKDGNCEKLEEFMRKIMDSQPELIDDPEIVESAKNNLYKKVIRNVHFAAVIKENLLLKYPEETLDIVKEALDQKLLLVEVRTWDIPYLQILLKDDPGYLSSDIFIEKVINAINFHLNQDPQALQYWVRYVGEALFTDKGDLFFSVIKPSLILALEKGGFNERYMQEIENVCGSNIAELPEILEAAQKGLVTLLENNRQSYSKFFKSHYFADHPEYLNDQKVKTAAIKGVIKLLQSANDSEIKSAMEIKEEFLDESALSDSELYLAAKECFLKLLEKGPVYTTTFTEKILKNSILVEQDDDLINHVADKIKKSDQPISSETIVYLARTFFRKRPEYIDSLGIKDSAREHLVNRLNWYFQYKERHNYESIVNLMESLENDFGITDKFDDFNLDKTSYKYIKEFCDFSSIRELFDLILKNQDYLRYLEKTRGNWIFSPEELQQIKNTGLKPGETQELVKLECLFFDHINEDDHADFRESFNRSEEIFGIVGKRENKTYNFYNNLHRFRAAFQSFTDYTDNPNYIHPKVIHDLNVEIWKKEEASESVKRLLGERQDWARPENVQDRKDFIWDLDEDGYRQIFETLSRRYRVDGIVSASEWNDKETISAPFKAGAEIFGYKNMFLYISRQSVSRHDALYAFNSIINLQNLSGMEPSNFFGSILQQVKMDNSTYPEGTSYHRLNSIALNISENFDEVIEKMKQYQNLPRLQKLGAVLGSKEEIFSSWANLKKYYEIQKLVEKTTVLDRLVELKESGQEKLYSYIETLAFHESSDVNMSKVFEFWENPEAFLATDDFGTAHDQKKPSNYTAIENLDLSSTELRDALVEGKLDAIQSFHPLEIVYEVPKETGQVEIISTLDLLSKALGSRKKGIAGQAQNPGRLFSEVNRLFKNEGISLEDYLSEQATISHNQEKTLELLINNEEFGIKKIKAKADRFRAKIYLKSDAEGVVAGNDTACCMTFGTGKNNVYTFNPVCSIFTIQRETSNGKWRTVAQSVLTEDRDIKTSIPDVIKKIGSSDVSSIEGILPKQTLVDSKSVITADNVEVSPNFFRQSGARAIIENIYSDFFQEYMARFNADGRFDDSKMIIGKGYSDALNNLAETDNTYLPQAPIAYSDNEHAKANLLDLKSEKVIPYDKQIFEIEQPNNSSESTGLLKESGIDGLSYLDYTDTLPVAYLEGKAYSDSPNLMTYLHDLENSLIAKDINNIAKGRPNLSLKWQDEKQIVHGYLLAYEGKGVVYISDLASDKESKLAGGSLIRGFIHLYKNNYLDKNDFKPICFEARESTSYTILVKQIDRIARDLGVELKIESDSIEMRGDQRVHSIVLQPIPQ